MNKAKDIELRFMEYAKSKGYTKKVVGDFAYSNRKGKICKLISSKVINLY